MTSVAQLAFELLGVIVLIIIANEVVRPYARRSERAASEWLIKRCETNANKAEDETSRAFWIDRVAEERRRLKPER